MIPTPLAKPFSVLSLLCALMLTSILANGQDKTWRPVPSDELQAEAPRVEPGADAEALFWDVWIDDSSSEDLSMRHYVRVKIFTERGREKFSKFDIPYTRGIKIKDLAARVIKADGTPVEIGEKDIFDREIVKAGGVKVKAKSFAVPNIEPGVIVEYRYRESISDAGASGMRLAFQRDVPVRELSYFYKPYSKKEPRYQSYNLNGVKFVKGENGFWQARRTNVASFQEEPRMPPEDNVRPWMLVTSTGFALTSVSEFAISYVVKDPSSPNKYWGGVATENIPYVQFMTKKNKEVRETAEQITAGITTNEEKLKKIYEFVQREIKNTTWDPKLTDEDRRKLPKVNAIEDVLKRKQGSAMHVDLLFGAMAASLGMDVKIMMSGDRSKMFFDPNMTNESFIHHAAIAVDLGGEKVKFYNPGVKFLPHGMLSWYEEDTWALLIGEKMNRWIETPITSQDHSKTRRTGRFKLLEDGSLEGVVVEELNGQNALNYRLANFDESAAKLEENIRESLKQRMSTAEVTSASVENLEDHSKPLTHRYTIRIPNYAQKTGKRLFLQPSFFEYGNKPIFSSSSRKFDVYFRYPWSENDDVQIDLPKGFELDNADAPEGLADSGKISSLAVKIMFDKTNNRLQYQRDFYFGGNGRILFPSASYSALKGLWDGFHKIDSHTISLKQN